MAANRTDVNPQLAYMPMLCCMLRKNKVTKIFKNQAIFGYH
jgi:hypothetical protein